MSDQETKARELPAAAEAAGQDKTCGPAEVSETQADAAAAEDAGSPPAAPATNGWLEQAYSHFDGIPLKYLDLFIAACVIALIAVVAAGVLKARGIL